MSSTNPFGAEATLKTRSGDYTIYRLHALADARLGDISTLPYSIRVLLEACLRNVDGFVVSEDDVRNLANWNAKPSQTHSARSPQPPICRCQVVEVSVLVVGSYFRFCCPRLFTSDSSSALINGAGKGLPVSSVKERRESLL